LAKLTEEQRKALEHLLVSRDLVMDVSGIVKALTYCSHFVLRPDLLSPSPTLWVRDPRDSPLRQRLLAGSDRSFTGPDSMRVAELDVRRSVLRESCRSGSSDPFGRGALQSGQAA
jgi:hypothetical protein